MNGAFPHPSLTPLQAEALTILAEEAAEVAQECSKILRMGAGFKRREGEVTNSTHLTIEITDFMVLYGICRSLGLMDTTTADVVGMVEAKVAKLKDWSNLGEIAEEVFG